MAYSLSAITNQLNLTFAPLIASQLNDKTTLIQRVNKTIGGGKNIAWDAKLARGTSAGSYASGATITGDDADTELPAVLQWKRLKAEFRVHGDAVAAAAAAGPIAYSDLFGKALRDTVRNLTVELGRQSYGDGTGNSSMDLDGMAAIIADTGSYAGISRTTYATWRGNVLANGGAGRNLTVDLMRSAERSVFNASGMAPDFIITTPAIYDKYEALFDPIRRIQSPTTPDYGAMSLSFRGIPIVRDVQCPSGKMFFMTRDSLEFRQLPPVPMADGVALTEGFQPMTDADGNLGLQVAIEMLGRTGDFYHGFVKLYGNLVGSHPNQNAVIADINEA